MLRAIAIVSVVVYHAGLFGFTVPLRVDRYGWIGVDLFFVLSGYLIGGQLLSTVAAGKSISFRKFYSRRALRILPAYLIVVLAYALLPASAREYERMPPIWKFLSFTQNLGLRGGTAFSHAWSLCIEFQFYVALPLFLLSLTRRRRSRFLLVGLPVAILLWCVLVRAVMAHFIAVRYGAAFGPWQQLVYYPTYARLDGLTIGVSLAAIELFRPRWWEGLTRQAVWLWLPAVGALILAMVWAENGLGIISSALGFNLVAVACGIFLICVLSPRLPFSRLAMPGAAFLATVAYSIYLTHKLAIHWIQKTAAERGWSPILAYVVAMSLVLFVGSILFFSVERPFLRLREQFVKKKEPN